MHTDVIQQSDIHGFSNHVIELQANAPIDNLVKTHVAADYPIINLLVSISFILLISIIVAGVVVFPYLPLPTDLEFYGVRVYGAIALFWLLWELYDYGANKRLGYCLREQDITLFKGWLFKKISTQPICRIQHIEVKQGPVDRKVGLAKLHVFSAGDLTQTFIIPGLEKDTAESIRNNILTHKELQQHG